MKTPRPALLIVILALAASFNPSPAHAAKPLAEKQITLSEDSDGRAELAKFFNEAALDPSTALFKAMAPIRKEYSGPSSSGVLADVEAKDILLLESSYLHDNYSARYLLALEGGYKSSVFIPAYFEVSTSSTDESPALNASIDRQVKVSIK